MTFTTFALFVLGFVYILTCLVLVLVVLMQEGKSGGMAGSESAAAAPSAIMDTFGAGKAQQGLFRTTIGAAAVFFVLAIVLTLVGNHRDKTGGNLDLPAATPAAATAPVSTSTEPAGTDAKPVTAPASEAAPKAEDEPAPAPAK